MNDASRLKAKYLKGIVPSLTTKSKYPNLYQVSKLEKIVVNMGVGGATHDFKILEGTAAGITIITDQKPRITRARKSIIQFKPREGQAIGCLTTLRGDRIWESPGRLLSTAPLRIRDLRGLPPKQFNGYSNYTFGLTEQTVLHEIDMDKIDRVRDMDTTVVTAAETDDEGRSLSCFFGSLFKEA